MAHAAFEATLVIGVVVLAVAGLVGLVAALGYLDERFGRWVASVFLLAVLWLALFVELLTIGGR